MVDPETATLDFAAFTMFLKEQGGTNDETIRRMKSAIPNIIREELTEKQRTYLIAYFVDGLTEAEIGTRYGVGKPTVSRGIRRGLKRLHRCLRFVTPEFSRTPLSGKYLSNRRSK